MGSGIFFFENTEIMNENNNQSIENTNQLTQEHSTFEGGGAPVSNKTPSKKKEKKPKDPNKKSLAQMDVGDLFGNSLEKKYKNADPMVIDFNGPDAVKSDHKLIYEFVAKNPEGKFVKQYIEAYSKAEVHSYLLGEGFTVYSIRTSKMIEQLHAKDVVSNTKMKPKDLVFLLTQLSTYIKAGIPLVDAVRVLEQQYKKESYKRVLRSLIHSLVNGDPFSKAMETVGNTFPKLLINMVRVAEMTGDLPAALDEMADYYEQMDKSRKQMITALMYPTMVFVFAIAVIAFVLIWVIPQFVEIYDSMDPDAVPAFTRMVMAFSEFLQKYGIIVLLVIIAILILLIQLYKKSKAFREKVQWLGMHLPVISNVIIYNEVAMFTKTFASLLKYNVFITDSMDILMKVTNNEIYKQLITDTINNLSKGEKLSSSFKDHWAFPVPAYTMLVTGEKTGQLPEMMGRVAVYYQSQHAEAVQRIKTFIEPVLIIFLTVNVGVIILSIIIPMFGMYDTVM